MNIKSAIRDAETLLKRAGLDYQTVCLSVDIHPSTWRKWRAGQMPQMAKWDRIQRALARIEARL